MELAALTTVGRVLSTPGAGAAPAALAPAAARRTAELASDLAERALADDDYDTAARASAQAELAARRTNDASLTASVHNRAADLQAIAAEAAPLAPLVARLA